jgi:hypothetical protein
MLFRPLFDVQAPPSFPLNGTPRAVQQPASSEKRFGTEDIRELNHLLDKLYMKRDVLGPRGHVLVKNMAEVR